MAADDKNQFCVGEIWCNCIEDADELCANDKYFCFCVVDDVFHFGWSKTPVDINAHCIDECCTKADLKVGDAVHVKKCDTIFGLYSGCSETIGDALGVFVHFSPRELTGAFNKAGVLRTSRTVGTDNVSN